MFQLNAGCSSVQLNAGCSSVSWQVRPALEPITNKQGLEWSDVVLALECIDEISELQDAIARPGEFFTRLAERAEVRREGPYQMSATVQERLQRLTMLLQASSSRGFCARRCLMRSRKS